MQPRSSALALTPLLLFLAVFFGAGLYFTAPGAIPRRQAIQAPRASAGRIATGARSW